MLGALQFLKQRSEAQLGGLSQQEPSFRHRAVDLAGKKRPGHRAVSPAPSCTRNFYSYGLPTVGPHYRETGSLTDGKKDWTIDLLAGKNREESTFILRQKFIGAPDIWATALIQPYFATLKKSYSSKLQKELALCNLILLPTPVRIVRQTVELESLQARMQSRQLGSELGRGEESPHQYRRRQIQLRKQDLAQAWSSYGAEAVAAIELVQGAQQRCNIPNKNLQIYCSEPVLLCLYDYLQSVQPLPKKGKYSRSENLSIAVSALQKYFSDTSFYCIQTLRRNFSKATQELQELRWQYQQQDARVFCWGRWHLSLVLEPREDRESTGATYFASKVCGFWQGPEAVYADLELGIVRRPRAGKIPESTGASGEISQEKSRRARRTGELARGQSSPQKFPAEPGDKFHLWQRLARNFGNLHRYLARQSSLTRIPGTVELRLSSFFALRNLAPDRITLESDSAGLGLYHFRVCSWRGAWREYARDLCRETKQGLAKLLRQLLQSKNLFQGRMEPNILHGRFPSRRFALQVSLIWSRPYGELGSGTQRSLGKYYSENSTDADDLGVWQELSSLSFVLPASQAVQIIWPLSADSEKMGLGAWLAEKQMWQCLLRNSRYSSQLVDGPQKASCLVLEREAQHFIAYLEQLERLFGKPSNMEPKSHKWKKGFDSKQGVAQTLARFADAEQFWRKFFAHSKEQSFPAVLLWQLWRQLEPRMAQKLEKKRKIRAFLRAEQPIFERMIEQLGARREYRVRRVLQYSLLGRAQPLYASPRRPDSVPAAGGKKIWQYLYRIFTYGLLGHRGTIQGMKAWHQLGIHCARQYRKNEESIYRFAMTGSRAFYFWPDWPEQLEIGVLGVVTAVAGTSPAGNSAEGPIAESSEDERVKHGVSPDTENNYALESIINPLIETPTEISLGPKAPVLYEGMLKQFRMGLVAGFQAFRRVERLERQLAHFQRRCLRDAHFADELLHWISQQGRQGFALRRDILSSHFVGGLQQIISQVSIFLAKIKRNTAESLALGVNTTQLSVGRLRHFLSRATVRFLYAGMELVWQGLQWLSEYRRQRELRYAQVRTVQAEKKGQRQQYVWQKKRDKEALQFAEKEQRQAQLAERKFRRSAAAERRRFTAQERREKILARVAAREQHRREKSRSRVERSKMRQWARQRAREERQTAWHRRQEYWQLGWAHWLDRWQRLAGPVLRSYKIGAGVYKRNRAVFTTVITGVSLIVVAVLFVPQDMYRDTYSSARHSLARLGERVFAPPEDKLLVLRDGLAEQRVEPSTLSNGNDAEGEQDLGKNRTKGKGEAPLREVAREASLTDAALDPRDEAISSAGATGEEGLVANPAATGQDLQAEAVLIGSESRKVPSGDIAIEEKAPQQVANRAEREEKPSPKEEIGETPPQNPGDAQDNGNTEETAQVSELPQNPEENAGDSETVSEPQDTAPTISPAAPNTAGDSFVPAGGSRKVAEPVTGGLARPNSGDIRREKEVLEQTAEEAPGEEREVPASNTPRENPLPQENPAAVQAETLPAKEPLKPESGAENPENPAVSPPEAESHPTSSPPEAEPPKDPQKQVGTEE